MEALVRAGYDKSDIDGGSPFYKVSSGIRLLRVLAFEFLLLDIS